MRGVREHGTVLTRPADADNYSTTGGRPRTICLR